MAAVSLTTIRMNLGDLEECWTLDQRCFHDGEAYDRETFRELLTHRDAVALKMVAAESVMVGFVIGLVEPDRTGHVVVLGVAPEWRRQGIGRALMAEVEDAFAARSIRTIHLEVRTTNNGARALYEQIGFAIAGRRLAYYTNGDDGYLMVKTV